MRARRSGAERGRLRDFLQEFYERDGELPLRVRAGGDITADDHPGWDHGAGPDGDPAQDHGRGAEERSRLDGDGAGGAWMAFGDGAVAGVKVRHEDDAGGEDGLLADGHLLGEVDEDLLVQVCAGLDDEIREVLVCVLNGKWAEDFRVLGDRCAELAEDNGVAAAHGTEFTRDPADTFAGVDPPQMKLLAGQEHPLHATAGASHNGANGVSHPTHGRRRAVSSRFEAWFIRCRYYNDSMPHPSPAGHQEGARE